MLTQEVKDVIAQYTTRVVEWVTFRRVTLTFLFAVLGVMLLTVFEQRAVLFSIVFPHEVTPDHNVVVVSKRVEDQINQLVLTNDKIIAMGVISADLRTNQRTPAYYYTKSPVVERLFDQVNKFMGPTQTIFSSNTASNQRMVSVINGEFSCGSMSDTLMAKVVPTLLDHLETVCFVGVPPYYGDFRGYVVVFLSRDITTEGFDSLRLAIVRVANDVYQEQLVRDSTPSLYDN